MQKLRVFSRMLKLKKDAGRSRVLFLGKADRAVPFCFLARENNFPLDGVIVLDPQQSPEEAFSGFALTDPDSSSFYPKQCLIITAAPLPSDNPIHQYLVRKGYRLIEPLSRDDIQEMIAAMQVKNYVFEKVCGELRRNKFEQAFLIDRGSKVRTIERALSMSGFFVDGVIRPTEMPPPNSLLIMPIEDNAQKIEFGELSRRHVGRVLPLYEGDLVAAEYYWEMHRAFNNFFDLDNAPDFVARHENRVSRILNAYDAVNVSLLDVENDAQVIEACALASLKTPRRVLQLVCPLKAPTVGSNGYLLSRLRDRIRLITPEEKDFWRYFIRKNPSFVTYSEDLYSSYAFQYLDEELKVEPSEITFDESERVKGDRLRAALNLTGEYVAFSIKGSSDWYEAVRRFLREQGIGAVKLNGARGSFDNVFLTAGAKVLVTDSLKERYLAMIFGVPAVLINMETFTLDEKLVVRSDAAPLLMVPKVFSNPQADMNLFFMQLLIEQQFPAVDERKMYFFGNGIKLLDNDADDIKAALYEMFAKQAGNFSSDDDDRAMHTFLEIQLDNSRDIRTRDVCDDSLVSTSFLRRHQQLLGQTFAQRKNFALSSFLPSEKLSALKSDIKAKIKVRVPYVKLWNVLRTICEACREDEDIDLLLIANDAEEKKFLDLNGYDCVVKDDYAPSEDKPDVFVLCDYLIHMNKPYGYDVREHSRVLIFASRSLVTYFGWDRSIEFFEEKVVSYNPDYYLFDSYIYKRLKAVPSYKDLPLIETGNAKYDGVYEACSKKISAREFGRDWAKLDGKKVILWAADHGIDAIFGSRYDMTLDVFAKGIFQYMNEHPDVGLIYRPHFSFIEELIQFMHFWSEEDLNTFRRYCRESPNVVFDETQSYDNAFALSDAIIVDPNCGIIMSALPTMKPMCLLCKGSTQQMSNSDMAYAYYKAFTDEDVLNFFGMVLKGDDPMYDIRRRAAKDCVKNFDGKNGWRIKEFIKRAFHAKMNNTRVVQS